MLYLPDQLAETFYGIPVSYQLMDAIVFLAERVGMMDLANRLNHLIIYGY